MSTGEARLHQLLDLVFDGSASDAELEEFGQFVDAHPEVTPSLAAEVFVHSLLQWESENVRYELAGFGSAESEATQPLPPVSQARSPFSLLQPWLVAAAALAAVIAALLAWQSPSRDAVTRMAVADVVEQHHVVWSRNSTALQSGGMLIPGRLETTGGAFTMRFRSGPTVSVSGPASMMIESDMLIHLDRGQATARVPEPIKGFTLRTPVVNVVDQGTEFGVIARPSGVTDVVVFDGKVDLVDSIGGGAVSKSLVRGEGARVNRQGSLERIMHVGRDRAGQWWTKDDPAGSFSLIRAVRDNVPADNMGSNYFCFQITNQGLEEDALAYSDHPHQWNGLTEAGLPEFLRGAEYVQTFNDYRYMREFEMVVELSAPANLYVFFDDRVPVPAWLTEDFEDTGIDIGLDEGPWEGIEDHAIAVGPGQSIDNVFSVWRRRSDGGSPVVLGPMGPTNEARAMYGIAVTPLEKPAGAPIGPGATSGL